MRTLFTPLVLFIALASGLAAQGWEEGPPMPTARTGAAGVVLGGQVVVIGGENTAGEALAAVEAFAPGDGWSTLAPLRQARTNAAAAILNGRIVVAGGRASDGEPTSSVEVYDPATNRWDSLDTLAVAREGLGAAVVDSVLYVVGGAGAGGDLLASAATFDTSWSALTPPWTLAPPRADFGMIVRDGLLITIGGFSAVGPLRSVAQFDPATVTASALPDLPLPRGNLAATTDGSSLFAIGGRGADDQVTNDVYELIAGIDQTWESKTPLPLPVEGAVAAVLDEALYVIGGADDFGSATAHTLVRSLIPGTPVADGLPSGAPAPLAVVGPNPSRGRTTLEIRAERAAAVRLSVFDALGREVARLHDGPVGIGSTRVTWAAAVPTGVYVARLTGGEGPVSVPLTVAR